VRSRREQTRLATVPSRSGQHSVAARGALLLLDVAVAESRELDDSADGAVTERRVGEEALRGAAAARQPPGLVSGGCEPEFGGCGA
jgi:hypothetical protein